MSSAKDLRAFTRAGLWGQESSPYISFELPLKLPDAQTKMSAVLMLAQSPNPPGEF